MTPDSSTPLMKQYQDIKKQYPNTILLYRMGDFYEMFNEDAVTASKILGITLTSRNHGGTDRTPLAGFPYHALDRYNAKLIKAGFKVAICEQIEDPKLAKGIVKRDVVEVVTAGTSLDPNFLDISKNNYLVCLFPKNTDAGLATIDLSTGEFRISELPLENIAGEIARIQPSEILIPENSLQIPLVKKIEKETKAVFTKLEDWRFSDEAARKELTSHFQVLSLDGFGLSDMNLAVVAAGIALCYVRQQKKGDLSHIQAIQIDRGDDFMQLDPSTLRNLELLQTTDGDETSGTLLSILGQTKTSMGARLLRRFLVRPLIKTEMIIERLSAVEILLKSVGARQSITAFLKRIHDIERIIGRVGTDRANARDLLALKDSLLVFPQIQTELQSFKNPILQKIKTSLDGFDGLKTLIEKAITEDPPLSIREGNLLRQGYHADLDQLRNANKEGKEWIASLQPKERERTGINSLKVGYNQVFGYYIEVSKANQHLVPSDYIRKQTLVNGERFITPQLKEWEDKVLGAEEKIKDIEYQLFCELRKKVALWSKKLLESSYHIAFLDVLSTFADISEQQHYIKPEVDEQSRIWIQEGRHPVVEFLNPMEPFVPNDLAMDNKQNQILLITGPNMAGKSTYLRQIALIVLMAQIGCFVPAKSAKIGVVDRIFTRVGASDKLAKGQSTFLVEMTEVANILRNATPRSLILLDEVGRGTSTYDGLSIAWSVTEHLHENLKVAAKTLFATHYHELAELATLFPRVKNYNVQIKEWNDRVIFLRKIVEGSCDHSYGIEVARLAGVPDGVISRAKEILANLEANANTPDHKPVLAEHHPSKKPKDEQLNLFVQPKLSPSEAELIEQVKTMDVNQLTPIAALQKLAELQKKVKENS